MLKSFGTLALAALATAGLTACGNAQQGGVAGSYGAAKIIGGQDATGTEDFAQTLVVLYNVAQGSLCTASILSDSILLTAAHCVEGAPTDLRVVFGPDLEKAAKARRIQAVEKFVVSPLWPIRQNLPTNTGDIALVKFKGGLPAGYKVAELMTDLAKLSDGQQVMLAGYGISDGVKQTGSGILRSVETTIKTVGFTRTEILIDQTQGKGACHGDSGGPAYIRVDGKLKVFGVTSRGVNDPNNDCSVAAAYTSVPFYAEWIARTSLELNRPAAIQNSVRRLASSGL